MVFLEVLRTRSGRSIWLLEFLRPDLREAGSGSFGVCSQVAKVFAFLEKTNHLGLRPEEGAC